MLGVIAGMLIFFGIYGIGLMLEKYCGNYKYIRGNGLGYLYA